MAPSTSNSDLLVRVIRTRSPFCMHQSRRPTYLYLHTNTFFAVVTPFAVGSNHAWQPPSMMQPRMTRRWSPCLLLPPSRPPARPPAPCLLPYDVCIGTSASSNALQPPGQIAAPRETAPMPDVPVPAPGPTKQPRPVSAHATHSRTTPPPPESAHGYPPPHPTQISSCPPESAHAYAHPTARPNSAALYAPVPLQTRWWRGRRRTRRARRR